jgi:hypothetical protein
LLLRCKENQKLKGSKYMKTSEQKEQLNKRRNLHHSALASIAIKKGASGLSIWRKLRKLEKEARDAATAQCNGKTYGSQPFRPDHLPDGSEGTSEQETPWEAYAETVRERVAAIFGKLPDGFSYNQDCRGYALKIRPERAKVPEGMQTDWGGNGCLAAEID